MNFRLLQDLRKLSDIHFHTGVDASSIAQLEKAYDLLLPSDHAQVLQWSNGIEAFAGYIRLFGVNTIESIDSTIWNNPEYWKFAWNGKCSDYWCFGETGWGDQYAYSSSALRVGENAKVYLLEALSMMPTVVASSFNEFFEKEFLRSAKSPYDLFTKQARKKLGPLEPTSLLIHIPSPLISGVEHLDNVEKMNARAAMICNGDIATQLETAPPSGQVVSVQPYEDELQRMRLKVIWA